MSHLLKDYLEHGLSDIIVIEHEDKEDTSGNQNERTWETVVARKDGKFVKVSVYELQKFGWAVGRDFSVKSIEEISDEQYQTLGQGKKIIDTESAREEIERREAEWLQRLELRDQLEKMAPKCPGCDSTMVARDGKFGPFWGCGNYPNCKSTTKMSAEAKKIYERV